MNRIAQKTPNESLFALVIRHFTDEDDLREKRDGSLLPGQEAKACSVADEIIRTLRADDVKIAVFISSSKKRALQTSALVSRACRMQTKDLKIIEHAEFDLREVDQGAHIIPNDYMKGDHFPGLSLGTQIFLSETFKSDRSQSDNLLYRFGDPVLTDQTYKYPELLKYFSAYGESYRDVFVRVLGQLIILSNNMPRYGKYIRPVIFAHAQTSQIFSNLAELYRRCPSRLKNLEPGLLARECWDIYRNSKERGVISNGVTRFNLDGLLQPESIELLQREVKFLHKC
jgi:broad specificity phosphatase PhoE